MFLTALLKMRPLEILRRCFNVKALSFILGKMLVIRIGMASSNAPKLPLLFPTSDTFKQMLRKSIFQHACLYSLKHYVSYFDLGPTERNALKSGWEKTNMPVLSRKGT